MAAIQGGYVQVSYNIESRFFMSFLVALATHTHVQLKRACYTNSQVVITTVKLLHNNSQAQTILCYCLLLHTAAYWHRPHSLHIYTITLSLTRQTIYPSIHSFIL
jgi:hypothetical protein